MSATSRKQKMRMLSRELSECNSDWHLVGIEQTCGERWGGEQQERRGPTSEKQEPSSNWRANSKEVAVSSKLSIAQR